MRDIKNKIEILKRSIEIQKEEISDWKIDLQKLEYELKLKEMTSRERVIYIIDEKVKLWQESGIDENYFFDDENSWDEVNIEINDIIYNMNKGRLFTSKPKHMKFLYLKNHLKKYVHVNGWKMDIDINTDAWYWSNMNYKLTIYATPNLDNKLEVEAYDQDGLEHGQKTYDLDLSNDFEILLNEYISKLKKSMVSFKVI